MRDAVKEYIYYSEEEKRDLWDNAIFVFDTNVYLNLYRYTFKTRELLLSAFSGLKERLWMPNHVAHEYMKNRNEVIWETNHQYDTLQSEANKFIELCRTTLKLEKSDTDLGMLSTQMSDWIKNAKTKNIIVSELYADSILQHLLTLYAGKVGKAFSNEELRTLEQEGKTRYAAEIPPGYRDSGKQKVNNLNNIYGDLIVWKQIITYAATEKKDIILVTNDQKEDWWEMVHGQTIGPRIELRKEFFESTKQRFHMYSMRSFITRYESGNDIKIDSKTIDEIEFFSKIIHHKSSKKELRDYYSSFENSNEAKAAKKRFEIMRLENKNRKRLNVIQYTQDKYISEKMPEDISNMLSHTITNYEKDKNRIQKLNAALGGLEI